MNKEFYKNILPGLVLSVAVATFSKILAIFLPTVGAATIAIFTGIFLGNIYFHQSKLDKGTKFSESKLLEISVVLLGLTINFQTISQIGLKGVLYILILMTATITFITWLGQKLRFNKKMSLMMAGGNAVCGSSAIGSIAPAIDADDKEKGQIITLVNLLGTIMMLVLPIIAKNIFPENIIAQSSLLGGTLQSVGQVVAGASFLGTEVTEMSMIFKMIRILFLSLVVIIMGRLVKNDKQEKNEQVKSSKKALLPWYILGFLLLCTLNSFIEIPTSIEIFAKQISNWFEITALAAIGLRLDFKKFIQEGPRFMIYGLASGTFQTVVAICLIYLLIK